MKILMALYVARLAVESCRVFRARYRELQRRRRRRESQRWMVIV